MISILFTRKDSIYKELEQDCWDIDRDAMKWPGGNAIVAHPPCRAWGRLKGLAKPREGEKECARKAVEWVRKYGGVLEHPEGSTLWKEMKLGLRIEDEYGGYTIGIEQHWWGHRARKKTWLYIVGVQVKDLPAVPLGMDAIQKKVDRMGTKEREATPVQLAKWLIEIANLADRRNIIT